MARKSLTEIAQQTRTIINFIIFCVVGIIILRVVFNVSGSFIRVFFKPVTPKADSAYGKLIKPLITNLATTNTQSPEYVLDLVATDFPKKPDLVNVYLMPHPSFSFLALDEAKELAEKFNFHVEPQPLLGSTTEYIWQDTSLPRELKIDITTGNFTLTFDYQAYGNQLKTGGFLSEETIKEEALSILRKKRILPDVLEEGTIKLTLLTFEGGNLREVRSLSEAKLARVDLFRTSFEKLPIVYNNPDQGLVWILISGSELLKEETSKLKGTEIRSIEDRKLLHLQYIHWPISPQDPATYAVKSAQTAWEEIKSGKGNLVKLKIQKQDPNIPYSPLNLLNLKVREIFLAYFDNQEKKDYIQPVWAFEGEANTFGDKKADFAIYVPAITDEWLKTEEE